MSTTNSYRLFLSLRSPFARRIRLALDRLDLPRENHFIQVFEENPDLLEVNPLGMVPALQTPEGQAFFDSSVILEQLHDLTQGIWPKEADHRIPVRQASALANGLIQATVAHYQETQMHDSPSPLWTEEHREAVRRSLKVSLTSPRTLWIDEEGALTQAGWDLAVALEYLEFRMPEAMPAENKCGDHSRIQEIAALANQSKVFIESKPRA